MALSPPYGVLEAPHVAAEPLVATLNWLLAAVQQHQGAIEALEQHIETSGAAKVAEDGAF